MRHTPKLVLGTVLALLWTGSAAAAFIRVDQTGGGDALTLAAGMALAAPSDTVAVRHGLHNTGPVELVDDVKLLGGWNSAFTSRTPGASLLNATGDQALRCTSGQGLGTIIDGFEITGASNSAVLCRSSSPTITNNEFHGNDAIDGGAIHCESGASPLIESNHIHHNSANHGGGIRGHLGSGTSPTIRNNLVEFNTGFFSGGGISVNNGSPLIEHNTVRFNSADGTESATGGGISVWHAGGGVATIRFNLIIHNTASEGGGVGITGGHPIIENNTIWGNTAPEGGAVYQEESTIPDPGTTIVSNNILGGSLDGHGVYCVDDLSMSLSCNCLFANAGGTYFGCAPGGTDIHVDPQFCDKPGDNYFLYSSSPCVPPGSGACGLIGAFDVGCGAVSIQAQTWADIKARYR
jgi:hypothetical protein